MCCNLKIPEGWRMIVGNAKGNLVVFGTNTQKPERRQSRMKTDMGACVVAYGRC